MKKTPLRKYQFEAITMDGRKYGGIVRATNEDEIIEAIRSWHDSPGCDSEARVGQQPGVGVPRKGGTGGGARRGVSPVLAGLGLR